MCRFILLSVAFLWSCGGQAPATEANKKVEPTAEPAKPAKPTLAQQLKAAKDKYNRLIVYWGDKGVWAETITGESPIVITAVPSAHPSFSKNALYYLTTEAGEVRRVDLNTGEDVLVVQLPKLTNPCFDDPNPVSYIQAYYDVGWNHSTEELCFRINDRNESMTSISMEMRVSLKTGKVASAYIIAMDECKTPDLEETAGICEGISLSASVESFGKDVPADSLSKSIALLTKLEGKPKAEFAELLEDGNHAPSGKWIQFSDFESEGDYIYSGLLFFNLQEGRVYGLGGESEALVPLDYVALTRRKRSYEPPDDICMVPGESLSFWSPEPDIFVFDNCVAGIGVLDLNKTGPARTVEADGFFIY